MASDPIRATKRTGLVALALLVALVASSACGRQLRRFPLQDPIWRDADDTPFAGDPHVTGFDVPSWDAVDQTFFVPVSRFLAATPRREAVNTNALDEVPDSSWFVNRIGRSETSLEEFARGACTGPPFDVAGPWIVTGGKPGGKQPGFVIETADGRAYLLKLDGLLQPERPTAGDAVAALIYHAAGYYVPCNRVVFFRRDMLRLAPDATVKDEHGKVIPFEWQHIAEALEEATRLEDGRYRAMASELVAGESLGPWFYRGLRRGDYNDVMPHEDRRELRGSYLLAAWLNRYESRAQNTLAAWIETSMGRGYVRHYFLDFGDTLGQLWAPDELAKRFGVAYYLDIRFIMGDLLGFGVVKRPWERVTFGPAGKIFGYWKVVTFEPDRWHPAYPNPAFAAMTERDAAWAARIMASFSDEHIDVLVAAARLSRDLDRKELRRILVGRRDRTLERWLGRLSPLTMPRIEVGDDTAELCLRDLLVFSGLRHRTDRWYGARAWVGNGKLFEVTHPATRPDGAFAVCARLPAAPFAAPAKPIYLVVDVTARGVDEADAGLPARVHLYHLGEADYRVVGLERPYDTVVPGGR